MNDNDTTLIPGNHTPPLAEKFQRIADHERGRRTTVPCVLRSVWRTRAPRSSHPRPELPRTAVALAPTWQSTPETGWSPTLSKPTGTPACASWPPPATTTPPPSPPPPSWTASSAPASGHWPPTYPMAALDPAAVPCPCGCTPRPPRWRPPPSGRWSAGPANGLGSPWPARTGCAIAPPPVCAARVAGRDRPGPAAVTGRHDSRLREGRPADAAGAGTAVAGSRGMTGLRQAADDYLAVRRALGFKLNDYPWLLSGLVAYLEAAGAGTVPRSWQPPGPGCPETRAVPPIWASGCA
jgi:hypothetical protein